MTSKHILNNRKEKKYEEFKVLAEMNKEIHSTMNINRLLQILVEKAVVAINFERCLIYFLENDFLRCVAWIDRIKRERASIIKKKVGFRMDEISVELLSVKTGKTIYIPDALNDTRVSPKLLKILDTREYCAVPLIGREKVLGVITGDKRYSNAPITSEEIETLNLFASHISLAIENAKLYQEKEAFNQILEQTVIEKTSELIEANQQLSKRMEQLSTLHKMSKLLNESLEKEAVLNKVGLMLESMGYKIFSIWAHGKEGYSVAFATGLDVAYSKLPHNPTGHEGFEMDLSSGNPFFIKDLASSLMIKSCRDYYIKKNLKSCLVVPVATKETLNAIIKIYSDKKDFFKEDLNSFFLLFGQQISKALENAIIFQTIKDEKDQITTLSRKIKEENIYLKAKEKMDFIVGKSSSMQKIMDLVQIVAQTPSSVFIHGETGTGKELIARAIHELSSRKEEPLITINCSAIPEELIEGELFGHEKGVFTGAHQRRIGMFELAQGGTIFLDEIGEMSLATQTKLLRVLQEKEIRRLGSKTLISMDVRVITATNRNLQERVKNNLFRSDLFYRINVFPILLPPLRERKEDIQDLVTHFIKKHDYMNNKMIRIDQEVLDILIKYSWPGNVRELENVIERLIIIARDGIINKYDLPKEILGQADSELPIKPLREAIRGYKKELVIQALKVSEGKKLMAAQLLGMPGSNFSRLFKELGITAKSESV